MMWHPVGTIWAFVQAHPCSVIYMAYPPQATWSMQYRHGLWTVSLSHGKLWASGCICEPWEALLQHRTRPPSLHYWDDVE